MHEAPRIRVCALLHRGSEVLLVRQEKNGRAYWMLPGGGVDGGETLIEALARELWEELSLQGVVLVGPIAMAESIAPRGSMSRRHIVHVLFAGELPDRGVEALRAGDDAIRNLGLWKLEELAGVDLRPPIHRFVERWRPGDPFVYLGSLWSS